MHDDDRNAYGILVYVHDSTDIAITILQHQQG